MRLVSLISLVMIMMISAAAQKPAPNAVEKSFLMVVEDVFHISGRGTVITGRIERGFVKPSDAVELVGIKPAKAATVVSVEAFQQMLTEGKAGDNVGLVLRGVEKD